MARLGPRVANPELATRLIEGAFEFGATIGQHAADPPAGPLIVRHHDGAQKRGRVGGDMSGQQPGQAVGRGRIAGRDLPDLADALEIADVEGVQTHQLAGLRGLDVARPPAAGPPDPWASPGGQQPGGARRVMLEDRQPSAPRGQARAAQDALHRTRRQANLPAAREIGREPPAAPGRRTDRQPQHHALDFRGHLNRTTRPGALPARMHPVRTIALPASPPAVEQSARDPQLAAHRADVAHRLRALYRVQPQSVYAVVEGHRSILPKWFPCQGVVHSGNDRPGGPLFFASEVSTLLRVRTPDRKSTRLNSSHPSISYAVFCLKKKNKTNRGY